MDEVLHLLPVEMGELLAGHGLPWDLFDKGGNLVWTRGTVIESQLHIDHAAVQGLYREAVGDERTDGRVRRIPLREDFLAGPIEYQSAREWFYAMRTRLRMALQLLAEQKPHGVGMIRAVAKQILRANARNRDATLATIQLEQSGSYRVTHAMHNAIVAVSIASMRKIPRGELQGLACAALTHDLMMPDQESLHQEKGPLSEETWKEIRRHPAEGAAYLRALGVVDRVWLETVEQHHERPDGSGYPAGLKRNDIRGSARVLAVADAWCAMFMSRAYRKPAEVSEALDELRAGADPEAATLLERAVGLYPPGAVVRLSNGETAIVIERGDGANSPKLMAVMRRDNTPYSRPVVVDLKERELAIAELTRFDPWRLAAVRVDGLWRLPVFEIKV
ncbi:HD-GYP domain-containing protein [Endothiovibrio diazotrophicus]